MTRWLLFFAWTSEPANWLLVSRGVLSAVSGHLFRHRHEPRSPFRWAPMDTPTATVYCAGMHRDAPGPCQVWSAGRNLWAPPRSRRASAQRSCRARYVEVATVLDVVLLGRVGWAGRVQCPSFVLRDDGWHALVYWLMLWSSRLAVAQLMLRFVSGAYCKDNFSTYIFLCCRCCGCYSVILLPGSPCIGLLRSCPNGCFHDCIGQPVGGAWCSVNLSRNQ